MMIIEPVDAVITWVNGNDKAHKEKMADYFVQKGVARPTTIASTRFNQCGEIDYCVRSLLCFAPWIRTIYIVTDAQSPAIIKQLMGTPYEDKIKLIDHRDIFAGFEMHLPTFNSLAIETMLWRIKGLSNQFIYFNDDCFLIRPVSYDDFFRGDKLVLRGCWKVQSEKKWTYALQVFIRQLFHLLPSPVAANEHRRIQENSAKLAGLDRYFFHLPHMPFAINKKTLEDFFLASPERLEQNISYAFRNPHQMWPISLAQHLSIQEKQVVFDRSLRAITINAACHSLAKMQSRLAIADKKKNVAFVCMQSIDAAPKTTQRWLFEWLENRLCDMYG